jgi:transcriptional regulator with XRE-family HTH domain
MNQHDVGLFIASKRREKNLTQEQLAEKIGVSNKTVSKWETGKTMPDYSVVELLCQVLNISVSELIAGKEKEPDANKSSYEEDMALLSYKIEQLENHLELIDENISAILTQKANTTDNDELFLLDKKYRDKIKEYKLITERIKELSQVAAKTRDTKERIERMSSLLKEGTITPNMLSKELIDSFIFTILVEDKNNVVVVINVSQNDSIKDIIAKRKSIIDFEPIYSSTTHLDRRFRPETINYKIVVI